MVEAAEKPRARYRRGAEVTLTIERMAYGGRGVGRVDGSAVFVPDTAPGDVARARLRRVKPAFAEADLVSLERPSPARTPPPCPHVGSCGGCGWQHLDYASQLASKAGIVAESLAHIAGLRDVPVRPILPSTPWAYRNKMEFTFHPGGGLGLHRRGAFDQVVPITRCLIQSDPANTALEIVRRWAAASHLPAYDPRTRTGLLRQTVIRQARGTHEMMVALVATASDVPGAAALAGRLREALPEVAAVLLAVNAGASDGLPMPGIRVLAGEPFIREELAGYRFKIGLETFFQTNTEQAERLVACVLEFAAVPDGGTVFDLYSGVGTFSLPLARGAARVHGVEVAAPAVAAAAENADWNGVRNVEFRSGEVRRVLPALTERVGRPDVVVLDPPRSGAGGRVMRKIADARPSRIVYASCNPTTLAPDLAELVAGGYAVRALQPLDLFPQTYHVETVVLLDSD